MKFVPVQHISQDMPCSYLYAFPESPGREAVQTLTPICWGDQQAYVYSALWETNMGHQLQMSTHQTWKKSCWGHCSYSCRPFPLQCEHAKVFQLVKICTVDYPYPKGMVGRTWRDDKTHHTQSNGMPRGMGMCYSLSTDHCNFRLTLLDGVVTVSLGPPHLWMQGFLILSSSLLFVRTWYVGPCTVCAVCWEENGLPIHIGISIHTENRMGMWFNTSSLALFAININVCFVPGNVHAQGTFS